MNRKIQFQEFFDMPVMAVTREDVVALGYTEDTIDRMVECGISYDQMIELHEIEEATEALLKSIAA